MGGDISQAAPIGHIESNVPVFAKCHDLVRKRVTRDFGMVRCFDSAVLQISSVLSGWF